MTKKSARKGGQAASRTTGSTARGSVFIPLTTIVSGSAQFSVTVADFAGGTFGTRLAELVGLYDRLRIKYLRFHALLGVGGQAFMAMASSGVGGAAPPAITTHAQASEMSRYVAALVGQTTPVTLSLNERDLQPTGGWYDADVGSQWILWVGAYSAATSLAAAGHMGIICDYEVEFDAPVSPAVFMERMRVATAPDEPEEGYVQVGSGAVVPVGASPVQSVAAVKARIGSSLGRRA
jgi:hypothetical protein